MLIKLLDGQRSSRHKARAKIWAPLCPRSLTDSGVVDVVISGNHAQVQRRNVHLVLDADALGLLQVAERLLH